MKADFMKGEYNRRPCLRMDSFQIYAQNLQGRGDGSLTGFGLRKLPEKRENCAECLEVTTTLKAKT
ncbi:hypothetical protein J6590_017819 [Homalodisca vitripennis]|nr:hypothetical protein J6590_017819 [Homalodisca vitripennis]